MKVPTFSSSMAPEIILRVSGFCWAIAQKRRFSPELVSVGSSSAGIHVKDLQVVTARAAVVCGRVAQRAYREKWTILPPMIASSVRKSALKRPASLALTVLVTWERPVALAWRMTSCVRWGKLVGPISEVSDARSSHLGCPCAPKPLPRSHRQHNGQLTASPRNPNPHQTSRPCTTRPCTSVKRKSRPA
jgi:hypothetical protein